MYIKEFRIRNFMIHQDTSVKLSPLTVFVGPNGGGKSAFFDAMLNFSMLSRGSIQQAFGPYPYSFRATLYRGTASPVSRIWYHVSMSRNETDDEYLDYEIDYAQTDDLPSFMIFNERLAKQPGNVTLFDRSSPESFPLTRDLQLENDRSVFSALRQNKMTGQKVEVDDLVFYCAQQISRFNKFRLDPYFLAQPSRLPEVADDSAVTSPPRIGYRGEDLATTLYHLAETRSQTLDTIRDRVKEIDPEFSDFDFNIVGTDRVAFSVKYSDRRQKVPAARLSSGNLIHLGLIVLVSTPNRPPVLMIEEPENGLTPQAIKAFYKAIRGLAHSNNPEQRSQVLMSSHSPFVICEAWNGEDRDFIHRMQVTDGKAQIRKFSDIVAEFKIPLAKDSTGQRMHLSLANAEEIMSGYYL